MNAKAVTRSLRSQIQSSFQEFFKSSSAAGIVILVFTGLAVVWSNSWWHKSYDALLHQPIEVTLFSLKLAFTFEHFVNDGLMVLFFFLVGLEIKREILVGELSAFRKAALPMIAAAAGMVVPGTIYAAANAGTPEVTGWGIPVATDIAFALGILALLGPRVPIGLKVFLAALAIVDDLLAVLVIAIFYTGTLNLTALSVAGVLVLLMFVMNRLRIHNIGMYGVLGLCLWVAVLFSGVHATIAGVLLAIMIPSGSHIDPPVFAQKARGIMDRIAQKVVNNEGRGSQLDLVHSLEDMCREVQSPLHRIEHGMQPYINFLVMPVFALVNAGVRLDPTVIEHLTSPVALGIMIGLVVGKQVGVTFAVWLGVRFGIAELPSHVSLRMIYGVSLLCGIGFSMALFVANLAFKPGESLDTARLSVLVASTVSAIAGFIALRYWLPPVTPRLDAA